MSRPIEQVYLDEKQKSEKVKALWQEVLAKREADSIEQKNLSPTDEKVSQLRNAIPTDIPSFREKSFASKIGDIVQIPGEDPKSKKIKGRINLHHENVKTASRIDAVRSLKILGLGKDLQKKLNIQKDLLNLKTLLPKDLSGKKIELSAEIKSKIDKLNADYGLNLDKTDISNLRIQIDSNLDSSKLEVQHGFTELQTQNHEKLLIFSLAQKMRDEKDTMVRNQRSN